jgi:hypothetical protein
LGFFPGGSERIRGPIKNPARAVIVKGSKVTDRRKVIPVQMGREFTTRIKNIIPITGKINGKAATANQAADIPRGWFIEAIRNFALIEFAKISTSPRFN